MDFPEKSILLKDGRTCVLRPAAPDDAEAMIAFMKATAGETHFLLRYPDEVTMTAEQEAAFLENMLNDPGAVMIAAVVDGRIAGNASFSGTARKRKIRHRCDMAIALYKEFHRLGIGTALVGYLTELARQIGYEQMDLEVYADNAPGQALYKKCGFIETGRRHNAVKLDDGTFRDYILMYKPL
ncbi:MAG: GNAT family N-acetyltransferase [Clostridia bacterium]|nr:GNAT family N-acetyltransferase [Clostridia bacterium]MBR0510871.1 GNAT family N-acetyltransferase [Clostridia bacterium]MBR0538220.1 GNAT family N-acetyltransferase [Clostridia bacterium]